ncbi:outer membrane-stress sensor serine endopeptidase DegS [Paraphotobacterium marinum]|uniref:Outer membrane-stress sensor serine endopeptidase DegS n=1 Tax=Paraphotobacterium marinum TaxID=1755811 RepID=A0A220VDA0_9GAMM|nr:outer membrane-stress sensor serine endopeptidase DegS [Paraphotobacterium marinum]
MCSNFFEIGKYNTLKYVKTVVFGIIIAVLLLVFFPNIRSGKFSSLFHQESSVISYNQAVNKAAPAVVSIFSLQANNTRKSTLNNSSLGSGVIIQSTGYILTNEHVIQGSTAIRVMLSNGQLLPAKVIGKDTISDIAVLKIDASNLPIITVNYKYKPKVGDLVLAIGNPYGLGQSVSQGIISAIGKYNIQPNSRNQYIQTDAAINAGNSGGALINSRGEFVGLNSSVFQNNAKVTTEGISFVIPYSQAIKLTNEIIKNGKVIRGYVGITGDTIMPNLYQTKNKNYKIFGLLVRAVAKGSPAEKSGIKSGDIIIQINNEKPTSNKNISEAIAELKPDSTAIFKILRKNKIISVHVNVEELKN